VDKRDGIKRESEKVGKQESEKVKRISFSVLKEKIYSFVKKHLLTQPFSRQVSLILKRLFFV
jgi:hypothetical protein